RSVLSGRRSLVPARRTGNRGKGAHEGKRTMKRIARSTAFTVFAAGAYTALVRPRLLRWGATREEANASYPGDDLIAYPTAQSTMAVSLPAPPEEVWPWLVQMGCGRAGWYSWDLLDNGGRPSADRIVPE